MKKILVLLAIGLLAGCSGNQRGSATLAETTTYVPEHVLVAPGNYYHYIHAITMKDGTKCVVMTRNSSGGGAISCNFRN